MAQKYTDRVKATIWTENMRADIEGNIAGGCRACFEALPTDKMGRLLEKLTAIHATRVAREEARAPEEG